MDTCRVIPPGASFSEILEAVRVCAGQERGRCLVAIGGCSRSGKSTLADRLRRQLIGGGISCEVLSTDNWIVDVRRRQLQSGVVERHECGDVASAVEAVLAGGTVCPPVYDPVLRQRIAARGPIALHLENGVLLAEGVVALLVDTLCARAGFRVYVETTDAVRRQRLLDFYVRTKGLSLDAAERLIAERDVDEVPAVRASAEMADVTFIGDAGHVAWYGVESQDESPRPVETESL